MGYYSEVAIRLTRQAADRLGDMARGTLDRLGTRYEDRGGEVCYHIPRMKWRNDLPDTSVIGAFLGSLDADRGECYEMIRLGEEEGDDFHAWTTCDTRLSVARTVDTAGFIDGASSEWAE